MYFPSPDYNMPISQEEDHEKTVVYNDFGCAYQLISG